YTATLDLTCCSFYNGDYFKADLTTDIRFGALFQIVPRYVYTYINLPAGLLNIHQITTDFIISFTPDMQLINQLQFDNVSQRLTLSMRYRGKYEPGEELFVSADQAAKIPGEDLVARSTQAIVRLGHT